MSNVDELLLEMQNNAAFMDYLHKSVEIDDWRKMPFYALVVLYETWLASSNAWALIYAMEGQESWDKAAKWLIDNIHFKPDGMHKTLYG